MNRNILIVVVIVLVVLGGAFFFASTRHTSSQTPTPTPIPTAIVVQPTVEPTAIVTANPIPTCTQKDVSATAAFDAGAGNVYGTFSLKNTSTHECSLLGSNYIVLNYDTSVKNLEVTNTPSMNPTVISSLKPGQTVTATVHYPNGPQCQGPIKQIAVNYTFKTATDTNIIFSDEIGKTELQINVCTNDAQKTTVQVSAFQLQ